jgi:Flp pilus assembly pilin Flp
MVKQLKGLFGGGGMARAVRYGLESAGTAVQYGLIAALVSVAAVGLLIQVGGPVGDVLGFVEAQTVWSD